jgi:hypothetical protein
MVSHRWPVLPLVSLFVWQSVTLAADDPRLKAGVTRLLDTGWQPSIKARQDCANQFEELNAIAPMDDKLLYAYVLVQTRQRQYPQASSILSDLLAIRKKDVFAWRMKIWLSMLQKDYSTALDDAQQLVQLLPRRQLEGEGLELYREFATGLGRMFGFMEGPVAEDVPATSRGAAQQKVLARLTPQGQEAFNLGRQQVLEHFRRMMGEGAADKEEAIEDEEQRRLDLARQIDEEREAIAAEAAAIEPERKKLESELRGDLDRINSKEEPLLREMAQLESRAELVRNQAARYIIERDRLYAALEKEKDKLQRELLAREIDRMQVHIARYDADLNALERQARVVNAQRLELVRQRNEAQGVYNREMQRLGGKLSLLERRHKKTTIDERQLDKPITGNTPRVRTLAREAKALTTYTDFPLDAERRRLLGMFE